MDEQERQLIRNVKTLQKDNSHLRAKVKVLDKKFDILQDEEAKMAIEMQSIVQSMNFIMNVALEIAKREGIRTDMGLQPVPVPPPGTPETPTTPGTVPPLKPGESPPGMA